MRKGIGVGDLLSEGFALILARYPEGETSGYHFPTIAKKGQQMSESEFTPIPLNPKFRDHTGGVFTRWTVMGYLGTHKNTPYWECACECGTRRRVAGCSLVNGQSKSCGCLKAELFTERVTTHGGYETPEYVAWANMWKRTTNPNHPQYPVYANRRPPDEWHDFRVFLEDVGPRPSGGLSLDRIDNSKPYGPGNCRWATRIVQNNNSNRNTLLTHDGTTLSMSQWARRVGVGVQTLQGRLRNGWSLERALTEPVNR